MKIFDARLGRDGKSGRHRDSELCHLGQVAPFAAEEIAQGAPPVSLATAKEVNEPPHRASSALPKEGHPDVREKVHTLYQIVGRVSREIPAITGVWTAKG
jgi:hypothetical protein